MKLYGQAESCANRILAAFQSGNLPKALAPVFIKRNDDLPCRRWSWSNQLLTALSGFDDARGFRQWLDVGRAVRKGQKSFQILGPIVKDETTKDESGAERKRSRLLGFRAIAVFGREQTDIVDDATWAKHSRLDESAERFIADLPLIDVARSWGLTIKSYSGQGTGALGWYRHGKAIAVGVENLATWAHELIHAADDRLGTLEKSLGQHWLSETVAELGGAILLTACGYQNDADLGGAWDYINRYAKTANVEPIKACLKALDRACKAVALVLTTSDELTATETVKAVA